MKLKEYDNTLFVSEAEERDILLEGHVPQAAYEIYARAKKVRSVASSSS